MTIEVVSYSTNCAGAPLGPTTSREFFWPIHGTGPSPTAFMGLDGDPHDNTGRSQPPRDARSANAPNRGGNCASVLRVDVGLTRRAKLRPARPAKKADVAVQVTSAGLGFWGQRQTFGRPSSTVPIPMSGVGYPSSNVVTPYTRSSATGRIGPEYIRAVSNTGASPCTLASATAALFGCGTSRNTSPATGPTSAANTASAANAYTAGRMKKNRIKILAGDRVTVEVSTYDLEKGRVIFRHKDERAGSLSRPPRRHQFRRR